MIDAASADLHKTPPSVTHKKRLAPSGDPHDYVSLRRYYWPNPDSADGFPWREKDGITNPLIHEYDRTPLGEMADRVKRLSLAYFLTGEDAFGEKSAELLKTWFFNPVTRMNPNMTYASYVPGTEPWDGNGIINGVQLIRVVESIGLLWGTPLFSESEKTRLQNWFRDFRTWLLTSMNGQAEQRADNNHGLWFDAQIASFSFFCDEPEFIKSYVETYTLPRIGRQIEPDGRMPREMERTLGLHYIEYALNALLDIASYTLVGGVDLWNYEAPNGGSIKRVVAFALPYFLDPAAWPYQQIKEFQAGKCAAHLYRIGRHTDQPALREQAKQLAGLDKISPHTLLVNGMWDLV